MCRTVVAVVMRKTSHIGVRTDTGQHLEIAVTVGEHPGVEVRTHGGKLGCSRIPEIVSAGEVGSGADQIRRLEGVAQPAVDASTNRSTLPILQWPIRETSNPSPGSSQSSRALPDSVWVALPPRGGAGPALAVFDPGTDLPRVPSRLRKDPTWLTRRRTLAGSPLPAIGAVQPARAPSHPKGRSEAEEARSAVTRCEQRLRHPHEILKTQFSLCAQQRNWSRLQALRSGRAKRNCSRRRATSMLPQHRAVNCAPFGGNAPWITLMPLVSRNSATGTKSRSDETSTAMS